MNKTTSKCKVRLNVLGAGDKWVLVDHRGTPYANGKPRSEWSPLPENHPYYTETEAAAWLNVPTDMIILSPDTPLYQVWVHREKLRGDAFYCEHLEDFEIDVERKLATIRHFNGTDYFTDFLHIEVRIV